MQRKSFDPEYTVKSVDKAFELLETLAEFPTGTSMQTLAELLGLSRNTT